MAIDVNTKVFALKTVGKRRWLRGEYELGGDASGGNITINIKLPRRVDVLWVVLRLAAVGVAGGSCRVRVLGQFMGGDPVSWPNAWGFERIVVFDTYGYLPWNETQDAWQGPIRTPILFNPMDASTDTPLIQLITPNTAAYTYAFAIDLLEIPIEDYMADVQV